MYVPPYFAQPDPEVLSRFLHAHSFALLVSGREGELAASHLPLLYDPASDGSGVLYGHMARANAHWKTAAGPVLAIFSGPHAYISPTWYEVGQAVPTWNYTAVHVYGRLSLIEDLDESLAVLRRLVDFYEQGQSKPWSFDSNDDWLRRMAAAIVAFRIDVTSIEGKWKLNQNRPVEQRLKVIAALEASGDDESRAVAELMRETLEDKRGPSSHG